MRKVIAVALALCVPWPVAAQNAITQEGTVLQNSPMMFRGNNRARQGAPVGGAPTGQTVTTGDSVVGGRCDYSAPTDDPQGYYRICINAKDGTIVVDGTQQPPKPLTFVINGMSYTVPVQASFIGSDIAVANLAALQALNGQPGQRAVRLGFRTPGDGGSAGYNWSATNCAGADDGAQVQPSGSTGCWIADLTGMRPTPIIWGAYGNGTNDDTVAVQKAVAAMAGSTLYLGRYRYCIGSPGIKVSRPLRIQGDSMGNRYEAPKYGLVACAPNIAMLTLFNDTGVSAANGARISDVYFEARAAGANTSGAGLVLDGVMDVIAENLRIDGACIGVDMLSTNSATIKEVRVTNDVGTGLAPGCGGFRVGHGSTGAGTVDPRIIDSSSNVKGDYSLLVEDAGGLYLRGSDFLYAVNGTVIRPGANQVVNALFATNAVLADSGCSDGLIVDTASATGRVYALQFDQTWTASNGQDQGGGCSGSGVVLRNTGGGKVQGIHFTGHRSYVNGAHGVLIQSGAADVTIDDSEICNNSVITATFPANHFNGIHLSPGSNGVALRNNRVSANCMALTGGAWDALQATGIYLETTVGNVTIIGNDLRGNVDAGLNATNGLILSGTNVVSNNNTDVTIPTIAAATSMTLPINQLTAISGTGTISSIANMWDGREARLYISTGSVTFATGGAAGTALCNGGTFAAGTSVYLLRIPGVNCSTVK